MSEMPIEILEDEEQEEQDVAILDDASAGMLMHRIKDANEEYDRMETWYKTQLKRLREKRDNTIAWAKGCLRSYFDLVPKKATKTQQSYQMMSGKLVMRQPGPEFDVDDEITVPWLKANGLEQYIKTKETVNWIELKKVLTVTPGGMVTDDGEIVPGITVTEREPEFNAIPN